MTPWAIPVGIAVAVFIVASVVWAYRQPRDPLPPIPRKALDNLPPHDTDGGPR